MDRATCLDLLPLYALGALEPDERRAVEAHLLADPEVAAELRQLERIVARLPESLPPVRPTAAVRAQVLARAAADASRRREPAPLEPTGRELGILDRIGAILGLAPASAQVMATLALALALAWGAAGQTRTGDLRARLAAFEAASRRAEALADRSDALERALALSGSPDAMVVDLRAEGGSAAGRLVVDPAGAQAVFVADGLPELPEGSAYQLWFITGDTATDAGVVRAGLDGHAWLRLGPEAIGAAVQGSVPSFDGVALSVEPVGGSVAPTGAIVLSGQRS